MTEDGYVSHKAVIMSVSHTNKCSKNKHERVRVYLSDNLTDDILMKAIRIIKGNKFHLVKICDCSGFDPSTVIETFGRYQSVSPKTEKHIFIPNDVCHKYVKGREEIPVFPTEDGVLVSTHSGIRSSKSDNIRIIQKPLSSFTIQDSPPPKRGESVTFIHYVNHLPTVNK